MIAAQAVEGHPNLLNDEVLPSRATARAPLDAHASRWPMVASHIAGNVDFRFFGPPLKGCLVDFCCKVFLFFVA